MIRSKGLSSHLLNWAAIVEDDLRPMIAEYWRRSGYTVTDVHARQELGADLICSFRKARKSRNALHHQHSSTVLIKRDPVQADLGQITTAKRNYVGPVDYYYTGRASGPFIAGVKREKRFLLHDEAEIEKLMIESDNSYAFYYAFKHHPAVTSFAQTITEIIRRSERRDTRTQPSLRMSESDLLNFYDGAVEFREIIDMTRNDVVGYATEIKSAPEERRLLLTKCADLLRTRLERLGAVSEYKLKNGRRFPRKLTNALHGYHAWGNTYANWLSSSGKTYNEHSSDVLEHLLHGYGYERRDNEFGISEAAWCLQGIDYLATSLKRNARNLVVGATRKAFPLGHDDYWDTRQALGAMEKTGTSTEPSG